MRNLFIVRGAYRVKTLFLKGDVFIEIWFLNENWIQNLKFKKISLRKTNIGKNFSKSARTKNSRFKNLSICRKKLHFKIWIFFPKIPFQTLIFNEKACFKIMPFKRSTKCGKFVVFCGVNWIRTFFFRCSFLIEIWFLNKNWTQKLSFWKVFFLQNMTIRKVFYYKKLPERKILSSKPDLLKFSFSNFHCAGKRLLQNLITFFLKISFQSLIFNEKVFYKIMLFKMSTQSEKLVVGRWANRVKTLCLRRDVFIEICFLDINWTQNLIFRKILYLQNDFSKSLLSKSAKTKNSRFKNWSNCRKKLHFKIRTFFQKIPFQNPIFNGKVYFKIMPFKLSTPSEKLVVCGENWVKTFFFQMWFFHRNLISQ